jgi:thiamine pyrophosphate-dependent acetolactate synthase large subunit-like protein
MRLLVTAAGGPGFTDATDTVGREAYQAAAPMLAVAGQAANQ